MAIKNSRLSKAGAGLRQALVTTASELLAAALKDEKTTPRYLLNAIYDAGADGLKPGVIDKIVDQTLVDIRRLK